MKKGERMSAAQKAKLSLAAHRKPPPEPAPRARGLIYFVQGELTKLVRIGFTQRPPAGQVAVMQGGSPDVLHLLGVMWGFRDWEASLHLQFASSRRHSEWFAPTSALLGYIVGHATSYEAITAAGRSQRLQREPILPGLTVSNRVREAACH